MTDLPPHHRRRAHTRTRDLERYAGLFAERTGVMRSSAMRDLMAVTARPEVISLAGGLPDTSTFPPQSFAAQMTKIAQESVAEALQYGPTEGFEETVDCILQVMGAEGMLPDPEDVIVTTGGQQAIDLVCKTLIDPGDVVICEAPTYPGAVPVFCSYQADVVQIEMRRGGDADRAARGGTRPARQRRTTAQIHLLGADLPEPGRGDDVAAAPAAADRARPPARDARGRGQPLRAAALRRRAAAALYQLEGGDFVIYLGTFSKILSPGIRLGWAVAPPPVMEKIVLGKQAADLCTSSLTQYFVREYFAEGRWRAYVDSLAEVYRGRRDTMVAALAEYFPAQATWTVPQGGLFIWATLPDYIDTGDLLARALRDDVAFVPGQAAYVDERGRSSMRLNFSGVGDEEIREGVRRIGNVIAEQVDLYGQLTKTATSSAPAQPQESDMDEAGLPRPGVAGGDVLPFRKSAEGGG